MRSGTRSIAITWSARLPAPAGTPACLRGVGRGPPLREKAADRVLPINRGRSDGGRSSFRGLGGVRGGTPLRELCSRMAANLRVGWEILVSLRPGVFPGGRQPATGGGGPPSAGTQGPVGAPATARRAATPRIRGGGRTPPPPAPRTRGEGGRGGPLGRGGPWEAVRSRTRGRKAGLGVWGRSPQGRYARCGGVVAATIPPVMLGLVVGVPPSRLPLAVVSLPPFKRPPGSAQGRP